MKKILYAFNRGRSSVLLMIVLPLTIIIILYNLYPFYAGNPISRNLPVSNVIALKTLLLINCITLSLIILSMYAYPIHRLLMYYGVSNRYMFLILIWSVIPTVAQVIGLSEILFGDRITADKAFQVYSSYRIGLDLYTFELNFTIPVVLLVLSVFYTRHLSLTRTLLTALLLSIISFLVIPLSVIVQLVIDGLISYFLGPLNILIYFRGWNGETINILLSSSNTAITLIPSWGFLTRIFSLAVFYGWIVIWFHSRMIQPIKKRKEK